MSDETTIPATVTSFTPLDAVQQKINEYEATIKEQAERLDKRLGDISKLQVAIESDADYAESWPLALGFTLEGVMRNFGMDGSDYTLYGRIRPCQHQSSQL